MGITRIFGYRNTIPDHVVSTLLDEIYVDSPSKSELEDEDTEETDTEEED